MQGAPAVVYDLLQFNAVLLRARLRGPRVTKTRPTTKRTLTNYHVDRLACDSVLICAYLCQDHLQESDQRDEASQDLFFNLKQQHHFRFMF